MNVAQRSFAAGELTPLLYARTDLEKYGAGAKTVRNFIVRRQGGLDNRPGTELVGLCPAGATVARVLPFVFNASQAYALEFTDRSLRFIKAGAYLAVLGVPVTLATPFFAADLFDLQISQSADVVTLTHPNYPPQELTRFSDTSWAIAPAVFAPAVGAVRSITALGGAVGALTYWAVTAISAATGEEGLPTFFSKVNVVPGATTPTTVAWDAPEGGALGYYVYRSPDGVTYGRMGPAAGTPQPTTDSAFVSTPATANGDNSGAWVAAAGQVRQHSVATLAAKAYDGQYTLTGTATITGVALGDTVQSRLRAYYSRDSETRVDLGVVQNFGLFADAGSVVEPFTITVAVPDNGYADLVLDFVPEVNGDVGTSVQVNGTSVAWQVVQGTYIDLGGVPNYVIAPPTQRTLFAAASDFPSAVGSYQERRVFAGSLNQPETVWTSRSASPRAFTVSTPEQDDDAITFSLVSRRVNTIRHVVDAFVFLVFTAGGEWIVEGNAAGVLTPTAVTARNFSEHGASRLPPITIDRRVLYVQGRGSIVRDIARDYYQGYKGSDCTIYSQHLFEGHTLVDWCYQEMPHSIVWAIRDDGTLLGLTDVDEEGVKAWHRHDTLGLFESCCVIPEGTEDALYLVVNRNGVRMVERMASRFFTDVQDVILTDSTLTYDGRNTDATKTMTLSGGTDWAAGGLLTCTASASRFAASNVGDQVVLTDPATGTVTRLAIAVYVSPTVVQGYPSNTVAAGLRGVAVAGWSLAVRGVSGLDHLEGRRVSVTADGTVVANPNNPRYTTVCTVSGGAITFDRPYSYAHVGLPYVSDLWTLDLDTPEGPSLREKQLLIQKLTLEVRAARGIFAGDEPPPSDTETGKLIPFKLRNDEAYGAPVSLTSGVIRIPLASTWNRAKNGAVFVRQVDPVPLSILAAIPTGTIPPAPAQ